MWHDVLNHFASWAAAVRAGRVVGGKGGGLADLGGSPGGFVESDGEGGRVGVGDRKDIWWWWWWVVAVGGG
jgi:hypothetical protein